MDPAELVQVPQGNCHLEKVALHVFLSLRLANEGLERLLVAGLGDGNYIFIVEDSIEALNSSDLLLPGPFGDSNVIVKAHLGCLAPSEVVSAVNRKHLIAISLNRDVLMQDLV